LASIYRSEKTYDFVITFDDYWFHKQPFEYRKDTNELLPMGTTSFIDDVNGI